MTLMKRLRPLLPLLLVLLLMAACDQRPAAYDYRSLPVDGWEPADTLRFHVDTLRADGIYALTLGLRTNEAQPYAYEDLVLVVRQRWHSPESETVDTLTLPLQADDGQPTARGVTRTQHVFPLGSQPRSAGQTADILVHHIMRCEMLTGVTEIGIRLEKD